VRWAIVGGFGLDHLKLIERPMPVPRHGDVVIRIAAVSLNYRDMDMVLGTYPFSFPLPLVPTSDGVGEVVAVGEGVTRAKIGDRVLGTFHQSWIAGRYEEGTPQLGGSADGMLAEYARLDQQGIVHAPSNLTDEEAATLPCAGLTSWHSLVTESQLQAGDTVLIQGTGGVSLFGLQFSAMLHAPSSLRAVMRSSNVPSRSALLTQSTTSRRRSGIPRCARSTVDGASIM
jgi:NADPH:quinone reductase-like Zn-dependent oxidoreductase